MARRLSKIKPSGIRRLFDLAVNMPEAISLGLGEPDFVPPKHVLEAVKQALDEGKTHYTLTMGIPELREALARKAKREYGLTYDPETEILITVGGTQAIHLALMALVNSGDEVLIPDPGFVCYRPSVLIAGGVPVSMPVLERNEFRLDGDIVMSHITSKSRIMIVNSPSNPTGAVFSYRDMASLAKIAVERDLIVISDEVYERITYDGVRHFCMASFPGMHERTLVVGSFSKTYAMTGLRIGYVLGPKDLIAPMMLAHQFSVACVNGPAQYAAVRALEGPQNFVKDMVTEFDRRRRLLCKRLEEIEGFSCKLPKGAFYVFANIKEFGVPSEHLTEFLLKEGKVVTVPGSAFGEYGEGYMRFSYATAYDKIVEAMDRIEHVVKKFKSRRCSG
jgi:aminotransferase